MAVLVLALCAAIVGVFVHLHRGTLEAKQILFRDSQGHVLAELGVNATDWDEKRKIEWPKLAFFDENGNEEVTLTELGVRFQRNGEEVSLGDWSDKNAKATMGYGVHIRSDEGEVALTADRLEMTREDSRVSLSNLGTPRLDLHSGFSIWGSWAGPQEAATYMQHSGNVVALGAENHRTYVDHGPIRP